MHDLQLQAKNDELQQLKTTLQTQSTSLTTLQTQIAQIAQKHKLSSLEQLDSAFSKSEQKSQKLLEDLWKAESQLVQSKNKLQKEIELKEKILQILCVPNNDQLLQKLEELHQKENQFEEAQSVKHDFESLLKANEWTRADCQFNSQM